MATIAVQKVKNPGDASTPLFDELRQMFGDVERKAFEFFQRRGGSLGHALDDWLQAERETLAAPPAELVETRKEFAIRMIVPGFSTKEVQVTATPQEVIVKAEHPSVEPKDGREDSQIRWSEIPGSGKLCRSVPLPEPVDLDKVSATLADGMLVIRAAKAEAPQRREVAVGKGA